MGTLSQPVPLKCTIVPFATLFGARSTTVIVVPGNSASSVPAWLTTEKRYTLPEMRPSATGAGGLTGWIDALIEVVPDGSWKASRSAIICAWGGVSRVPE